MLSFLARAAGLAAYLMAAGAAAFPVISTSPERVRSTFASNYQDGYANAAGVYTHYQVVQADGTWAPAQELRDLTQPIRNGLANHTVRLVGYSLADSSATFYGPGAGQNGADLQPHRAAFGGLKSYAIWFDGAAVDVDVQIKLDFSRSGLDAAGQATFSKKVETSIEGWWNGTFHISKDDGRFNFGLLFDVTFDGDNGHGETFYDHTVNVVADPQGTLRSNEDTFSAAAGEATLAHEFGHMLGLYDEYWGGALDPGNGCGQNNALCATDYAALMGTTGLAFGDGLKASYFNQFAVWLDDHDADPAQTYAVVDEPGTVALAVLAALLAGLVRRPRLAPARPGSAL